MRLLNLRFLGTNILKKSFCNNVTPNKIISEPKRPMIGFFRFRKERIKLLRGQNLNRSDLAKNIAEQWKSQNADVKHRYNEVYRTEMEKYKVEFKKYQDSLSDEECINNEEVRIMEKNIAIMLAKPKSPLSPYHLFMASQKSVCKMLSVGQHSKKASELWKSMSEEDKAPFIEQSTRASTQYEADLKKWKIDMTKGFEILDRFRGEC